MNDNAFLMNRPLTSLARQTQTDAEILPPRPAKKQAARFTGQTCGSKNTIAARIDPLFCLKSMGLLPKQSCFERSREGRLGKKNLPSAHYLRVSAV